MLSIKEEIEKLIEKHLELWERKEYTKGTILHKTATSLTQNYFIVSGVIKWYSVNPETKKQIITHFSEGGAFLPFTINPDKQAVYQKEVLEDAVVYTINEDNFVLLRQKEKVFDEIIAWCILKFVKILFRQIECLTKQNVSLKYKDAIAIYPCLANLDDNEKSKFLGVARSSIIRAKKFLLGRFSQKKK